MATSIRAAGAGLAAVMADHDRGPQYAMLQCAGCPEVVRISGSDRICDSALRQMFADLGWSIQPTRCPACRSKAAKP